MILSNHPDSGGWSYRPDAVTRPLKEVIQLLCSGACGDGNVLLNLAPMPTGEFRPEELAVLRGLAPWMQKYGEAIHETRGGPWVNGLWGGATHRGDTVYLHVFQWTDGKLRLPALKEKITRAELLTVSGPVAVEQTDAGVTVRLESRLQDPIVTLIKLKLSAAPASPVGAPGAGK
jgi:alpha-L-fucosidase